MYVCVAHRVALVLAYVDLNLVVQVPMNLFQCLCIVLLATVSVQALCQLVFM